MVGQLSLVVLWIVARLVLPTIANVACDGPTVVVGKTADAADLPVVLGVMVHYRRVVTRRVRDGVSGRQGCMVSEVVTIDRLDRKRGVCHAIPSEGERL
jgi:hypothetical protein